MKLLKKTALLVATIAILPLVTTTTGFAAERPAVNIIKDTASAEVIRAKRKGDNVEIELRFNTLVEPFSGAIIYEKLDRDTIYLSHGEQKWPLASSEDAAPQELKLNFSYDMTKTPRIGQWKGKFTAPPTDINEVDIHITGLPIIKNVTLK